MYVYSPHTVNNILYHMILSLLLLPLLLLLLLRHTHVNVSFFFVVVVVKRYIMRCRGGSGDNAEGAGTGSLRVIASH